MSGGQIGPAVTVEVLEDYIQSRDFEQYLVKEGILDEGKGGNREYIKNMASSSDEVFVLEVFNSSCAINSPGNIILRNHNLKTYIIRYSCFESLNSGKSIVKTFKFTR